MDRGTSSNNDAARLGLTATLRPGDDPAEVARDLARVGLPRLRAALPWSAWAHDAAGAAALLEALARDLDVLPGVIVDGAEGDLAEFVEAALARCGPDVGWVELALRDGAPAALVADAARRVRALGRRVALSVAAPTPEALEAAPLEHADAVGLDLEGVPLDAWEAAVRRARAALPGCPAWVVRAGATSFPHEELEQARALLGALTLPTERLYWDGPRDAPPAEEGGPDDPRAAARGLLHHDGREKLLARLLAARGLAGVREVVAWAAPRSPGAERGVRAARAGGATPIEVHGGAPPVLITGGAGFVGSNLAARLLAAGRRVVLYDDLSRPGVEENARWLLEGRGDAARLVVADVRDRLRLRRALEGAGEVFHLAGQVAVTTSLERPTHDFEVNALGTHVLLEELRRRAGRGEGPRALVFTSTNKVYGGLPDLPLAERPTRWEPADPLVRARGISEDQPLDLHSPYGCSKGAADQYVVEYARTFGIPGVVLRMSCIYGPRQLGTPDQGWVSQFALCALEGAPLVIYGDGKQVRDVLHIDDLVDAFLLAAARAPELAGRAFNIGGGPQRTVSLIELLELLRGLGAGRLDVSHAAWRPGDQRYYVSDSSRFRAATGWSPRVGVHEGVGRLVRWLGESPAYARRARSA
ncbi:MAG: GDP-mannose 4,6-dehydratase [Planctomycetes bacterium]|nr:GDP-mannose 4,6-dehydratase [Planctomycetota bacterium]